MLKDVMEIPEDEIIDWYLDNIDMLELVNALKLSIKDKILCKESADLAFVDKFIKYANFDGSYENTAGSYTSNDKQNKKTTKSSSTNKVKTVKSKTK
jgi:elongation factor P--beta-lysine ligase